LGNAKFRELRGVGDLGDDFHDRPPGLFADCGFRFRLPL